MSVTVLSLSLSKDQAEERASVMEHAYVAQQLLGHTLEKLVTAALTHPLASTTWMLIRDK